MVKKVDIERSVAIAKLCGSKVGECYDNIYKVVGRHGLKDFNVVLGYTLTNPIGMLNRHMWLETKEGVIIDPTYVLLGREKEDIRGYNYYDLKKLKICDYFEVLIKNGETGLRGIYCEKEVEFYKKNDTNYFLKKHGMEGLKSEKVKEFIFINDNDYETYILPTLIKNKRSGSENGI